MIQNIEQARTNMILCQFRSWNVLDDRLLDIFSAIPRENFVPEAYKHFAFSDMHIPIGNGQVLFPPKMEARLIQALDVQPSDRVLEVGTGYGFTTAVLATLAKKVVSVSDNAELSEIAKTNVESAGLADVNVTFEVGDAANGWPRYRPYDVIFVTGSLPVYNDAFEKELSIGGRLLAIVGESPVQEVMLITRVAEDQWERESLMETDVPKLANCEEPDSFVF